MMKKSVSAAIAVLIAFSLTGCGTDPVNTAPSPAASSEPGVTEPNSPEPSPAGPYEVRNEYLADPGRMIELADQSAAFWKNAYDPEYGGFFTYVSRDGSVDMTQPYKVTFIQSRAAYAFSRAYQLTGNEEYLDYARYALDFMYAHCWDRQNGGWYQELNRDGSLPDEPLLPGMEWNAMKWLTLFTNKDIGAYVDATRNEDDRARMIEGYRVLDSHMWDGRPGYEGYFERADADWSDPMNKGLGPSEGSLQEYLAIMPYLNQDAAEKQARLKTLADIYVNRIVGSMDSQDFGMIETFDSDWTPLNKPPQTNSGNFTKPAWFLAMAYLELPDEAYKTGALKLVGEVLYGGAYDDVNGGFYDTLSLNGQPADGRKGWWTLGQGVFTGLIAQYISGNDEYLRMADESMDFIMDHMYDREYGEMYGSTDADGSNPDTQKGNYFKGGQHAMELYYYGYLYGRLMLHDSPVSLYYMVDADDEARDIILEPISLGAGKSLAISGVTLDGEAYTDFDQRVLHVPAGTGGEFMVTFTPADGS